MKNTLLPLETEIEVIAIKGGVTHKKVMTYGQALEMTKKPGYQYRFYQLNFSQFKTS